MLLREMTEEDLPQVYAIEQESFSDPWSEEDFNNSMNDINNAYVIAEVDGIVAGYCGYWGIAGEGYIYNVAVKKEYRRLKIGFQMMTKLLKDSEGRGITALTLEVRSGNEPAIKLYESLGFEKAGVRREFYSKPKEDAVIMWLRRIQ